MFTKSNQNLREDNTCYRGDDCQQANEGQQIVGKNNDEKGFNDQSDNPDLAALAAGNGTKTGTNGTAGPARTPSTTIINNNTTLVTVFLNVDLCSLDAINYSNETGNTNKGSLTFTVTIHEDSNLGIGMSRINTCNFYCIKPNQYSMFITFN